ncbi:MAG TPA: ATP-binding cassette domain-containing protein, partial [Chiayiivirga sp.]|nr:ATP-binding cassette domain-containing protein [Chiayiivirga sp.]
MSAVHAGGPVIRVRGLRNQFGAQVVHENLDLDVRRGEILGVVGGSGSGKSVLMRSIIGLNRPAAGEVSLFGEDVTAMAQDERARIDRRSGVLFQYGALFSSLTVAENVEAPMRELRSLSAPMMARLAALKLALAGLPAS